MKERQKKGGGEYMGINGYEVFELTLKGIRKEICIYAHNTIHGIEGEGEW